MRFLQGKLLESPMCFNDQTSSIVQHVSIEHLWVPNETPAPSSSLIWIFQRILWASSLSNPPDSNNQSSSASLWSTFLPAGVVRPSAQLSDCVHGFCYSLWCSLRLSRCHPEGLCLLHRPLNLNQGRWAQRSRSPEPLSSSRSNSGADFYCTRKGHRRGAKADARSSDWASRWRSRHPPPGTTSCAEFDAVNSDPEGWSASARKFEASNGSCSRSWRPSALSCVGSSWNWRRADGAHCRPRRHSRRSAAYSRYASHSPANVRLSSFLPCSSPFFVLIKTF